MGAVNGGEDKAHRGKIVHTAASKATTNGLLYETGHYVKV
jgi:hypothetical protein